MRLVTALFVFMLLAPPLATAAPGCFYPNGDFAMNCGGPGTMPPGWRPSPETYRKWLASRPQPPQTDELLGAFLGIAALFALIALMPRFDGSRSEDWSRDRH